jgi:hypothetical protein
MVLLWAAIRHVTAVKIENQEINGEIKE